MFVKSLSTLFILKVSALGGIDHHLPHQSNAHPFSGFSVLFIQPALLNIGFPRVFPYSLPQAAPPQVYVCSDDSVEVKNFLSTWIQQLGA